MINLKQMKKVSQKINNEEIVKISQSAAARYKKHLSNEEIQAAVLRAIWNAWQRYNDNRGTKFSSYLYRGVQLECKRQIVKLAKSHLSNCAKAHAARVEDDHINRVDMAELITHCRHPDLIYKRYYMGMNLKEIGKEYGCSGENIRQKINTSLEMLKMHLTEE